MKLLLVFRLGPQPAQNRNRRVSSYLSFLPTSDSLPVYLDLVPSSMAALKFTRQVCRMRKYLSTGPVLNSEMTGLGGVPGELRLGTNVRLSKARLNVVYGLVTASITSICVHEFTDKLAD